MQTTHRRDGTLRSRISQTGSVSTHIRFPVSLQFSFLNPLRRPARTGPFFPSQTLILDLNHRQAPPISFINYAMQRAVCTARLVQPISLIPHLYRGYFERGGPPAPFPTPAIRCIAVPPQAASDSLCSYNLTPTQNPPSDLCCQFEPTSLFIPPILIKRPISHENHFFSSCILTHQLVILVLS